MTAQVPPHVQQTFDNILKLTITGADDEWEGTIFKYSKTNLFTEPLVVDRKRFIALNQQGLLDIGFFPNVISETVTEEIENVFDSSGFPCDYHGQIIDGTWSRRGNALMEVKSTTENEKELLDKLNKCCQTDVMRLVKLLNLNMFNKLQKLNPEFKKFANYPTLALNILSEANFDENKKPYYFHHDEDDEGMGVLVFAKTWTGGTLEIQMVDTGNIISFCVKKGDVLLLNSKVYRHRVTKVTSGVRLSLVYFAGSIHFRTYLKNKTNKKVTMIPNAPIGKKNKVNRKQRSKVKKELLKYRNSIKEQY